MKRTISEVIELIKQKKESAEKTLIKLTNDLSPETLAFREKEEKFIAIKVGYVEAYTDVLALLESSHLVEQEEAIEILKDKINIIGNDNLNYYQLSLKPDKCVGDTADIMLISKEEYDLLNEELYGKNI